MSRRLKAAFFNDFTGGLNFASQPQSLSKTETPLCMNVDFDNRGGFRLRRGFQRTHASAELHDTEILGRVTYSGTDQVIGVSSVSNKLWRWDGSTFTLDATVLTDVSGKANRPRMANWSAKTYFAHCFSAGNLVMRTWTGAAYAVLSNVANNNYSAPTGGNAPLARHIANHSGHMFWADTTEAGTRYRNRVRWSHPLQPEDWATADYFDIDPDDESNPITAIVPFRNMLLVFKRQGIWAIYGSNRDEFVVERLSTVAGVVEPRQITASATTLFWWSPDGEVYQFDGSQIVPIGGRISTISSKLKFVNPNRHDHVVCWAENRLYVSLHTVTGAHRLFVFDPMVGREGAWTEYDVQVSTMFWWRRTTGASVILFGTTALNGLYNWSNESQQQDNNGSGDAPIVGFYRTAWFSASNTALLKRWRRPYVTAATGDPCDLLMKVYYDFDESTVRRTLTMALDGTTGSTLWGGSTWGGGSWSSGEEIYGFERLQSGGRSRAIAFEFRVTNHLTRWQVDSYTIPFYEKGIK